MRFYLSIIITLLLFACHEPGMKNNGVKKDSVKNYRQIHHEGISMSYNLRVDLRFHGVFYSMLINPSGQACILRGKAKFNDNEPFEITKSDTSKIFKLDSTFVVYNAIYKIRARPKISEHVDTDTARVEMYYDGVKIYDGTMGEQFWDALRPTFGKLPRGYCFYCSDDHPFEWEYF